MMIFSLPLIFSCTGSGGRQCPVRWRVWVWWPCWPSGSQHWMRTEPRPWSTTYRNYSKELDVNSSGNILLKVLSSMVIEGTLNKQYWAMSFIAIETVPCTMYGTVSGQLPTWTIHHRVDIGPDEWFYQLILVWCGVVLVGKCPRDRGPGGQ